MRQPDADFALDAGLQEIFRIQNGGRMAHVVGQDHAGHRLADSRRLLQRGGGVGNLIPGHWTVFCGQRSLIRRLNIIGLPDALRQQIALQQVFFLAFVLFQQRLRCLRYSAHAFLAFAKPDASELYQPGIGP